jgi:hypothetical protein
MNFFYWAMGLLILGTFLPSVVFLLLYAVTGNEICMRRASALWNFSRVFAALGANILIWGHVFVGLWRIWFH